MVGDGDEKVYKMRAVRGIEINRYRRRERENRKLCLVVIKLGVFMGEKKCRCMITGLTQAGRASGFASGLAFFFSFFLTRS